MSPKKRKMFMAAVSERRRRDASPDLGWSTRRPGRAETSRARARVCLGKIETLAQTRRRPAIFFPKLETARRALSACSRRITNP
jgi:hypothetical protein